MPISNLLKMTMEELLKYFFCFSDGAPFRSFSKGGVLFRERAARLSRNYDLLFRETTAAHFLMGVCPPAYY